MPFGDGTGPRGMGPMTGRGAGYCTGFGRAGFANPVPGRGWVGAGWGTPYGNPYLDRYGSALPGRGFGVGRGRGFGRGRGRGWLAPYGRPW